MKPLKECSKEELISLVTYHREKELYFANLLNVADAGQFRADWDGAVLRILQVLRVLTSKVEEYENSLPSVQKRRVDNELLQMLLHRAKALIKQHEPKAPIIREIDKALAGNVDPRDSFSELQAAIETCTIHLAVWHSTNPDAVDESDKIDLNWALGLIGRPKRYQDVPDKDKQ